MTNLVQLTSVEESNCSESGPVHTTVNRNYVNESAVTEYGSCHAEIKVNGIDKSDIIESGSRLVKIETNDVGKSDVIDSGSGNVKNKSTNLRKDVGVPLKLCKKTYVLSNAVSAPAQGHLATIEGYNSTSHNSADRECQPTKNWASAGERTASEKMEINHGSSNATAKPVAVSPSETSSDSKSNNRVLPANCDVRSAADSGHVGSGQLALLTASADTRFRRNLSARTRTGDNATESRVVIISNHHEGSEADDEQQTNNCRLISDDLPTVHKEGGEADRHQVLLTDCRLISAKPTSDNSRTAENEGSETDKHRRRGNCQLPTIHYDSGETDQQRQTVCKPTCNSPKTRNMVVEIDQNAKCQLSTTDNKGSDTDRLRNCQSPTVCNEGSGKDRKQRYINCMVTPSDNSTKTCSAGVEADRKANSQTQTVHSKDSEADRQQDANYRLPKVDCKGAEAERTANSPLIATVQKHQMLVDCDVNVPHNIWTSVVNHGSPHHQSAMSDDSPDVHVQSGRYGLYSTSNEVSPRHSRTFVPVMSLTRWPCTILENCE